MFKPPYQVAVLYSPAHPEQEINQRHRQSMLKKKKQENIWEL